MSISALDAVRQSGVTIASDGAEYEKYSHILDEAVNYSVRRLPGDSIGAQTQLALDRILVQVGVQILKLIPGRVSLSADPRLGYDYDAIVAKVRAGHLRSRILIKIPATYPGIRAAHTLQNEGIQTNMTLIFSLSQALACAQAGVAVISPFIGRVKDWWSAQAVARGEPDLSSQPLSEHAGIVLVHRIRAAYAKYGHKTKSWLLGSGGPDLVTLPPDLLDSLRSTPAKDLGEFVPEQEQYGEAAFAKDSKEEAIALDKVPEGLEKFSVDARLLEEKVRGRVTALSEMSTSPRVTRDGWAAH
ncbi:hypothetical protein BDQ17DRAFT_1366593 [Cyathus striatus]|nr:hypothetical protein BDQ17DRAFT_1366593 [Cyathus striatus]